jgi:CheY-like chemotaxis protein
MAKGAYILVVDDDPMLLEALVDRLEKAGYQVTSATDAWQEVVQAQGLKIGLILTDVVMPGVGSGVDAYRKLRSMPTISPQLPIIFMSGFNLEEVRAVTGNDPNVRFLQKPLEMAKLRKAIHELTGVDRPLE